MLEKITIDSTIPESLNNEDLLKTAFNNKWITERELQIMSELDVLFSPLEMEGYYNELENLIMADEIDVDPQFANTTLTSIFLRYSLNYIKNMGVLIDEGAASEIGLYKLSVLVNSLNNLNSIPEDLIPTLSGILENKDQYDKVELLYVLLNAVESSIDTTIIFKTVIDVYPNFFTFIENAINNIVEESENNFKPLNNSNKRVGELVSTILTYLNKETTNTKLFPTDDNISTKYKFSEMVYAILLAPDSFYSIILNSNKDFYNRSYKETKKEINLLLGNIELKSPIEQLGYIFYNLSTLIVYKFMDTIINEDIIDINTTLKEIGVKVKSDAYGIFKLLPIKSINNIISIYVDKIIEILNTVDYFIFLLTKIQRLKNGE